MRLGILSGVFGFILIFASCSENSGPEPLTVEDIQFIENLASSLRMTIVRKDTSLAKTITTDSVLILHPNKVSQKGVIPFINFTTKNQWDQFQISNLKIEGSAYQSEVSCQIRFQINQKEPLAPKKYAGEILLVNRKDSQGVWEIDKLAYSTWQVN